MSLILQKLTVVPIERFEKSLSGGRQERDNTEGPLFGWAGLPPETVGPDVQPRPTWREILPQRASPLHERLK
eukprot:8810366-Pyramimonas_sp.AAC.1